MSPLEISPRPPAQRILVRGKAASTCRFVGVPSRREKGSYVQVPTGRKIPFLSMCSSETDHGLSCPVLSVLKSSSSDPCPHERTHRASHVGLMSAVTSSHWLDAGVLTHVQRTTVLWYYSTPLPYPNLVLVDAWARAWINPATVGIHQRPLVCCPARHVFAHIGVQSVTI